MANKNEENKKAIGKLPTVRRNVQENLVKRAYPKGAGCLVLNASLISPSIDRMKELFVEAFAEVGYRLDVLYSDSIARAFDSPYDDLHYPFFLFYDKDVLLAHLLEARRKRLFNSAWAISNCDSKSLTQLHLENAGLPIIPTIASPLLFEGNYPDSSPFLLEAINRFGFPFIIKEDIGSLGQQVHLAKTKEEAEMILEEIGNKRVLLQPYLSYKKGTDLRVYVVGNKVIGAMERHNPNDFRSNIENGGTASSIKLPKKAANLAKKAAKALDLEFAGVDLLYLNENDFAICEVNSNPHFLGLLNATGIDLSKEIAKHIDKVISKDRR